METRMLRIGMEAGEGPHPRRSLHVARTLALDREVSRAIA